MKPKGRPRLRPELRNLETMGFGKFSPYAKEFEGPNFIILLPDGTGKLPWRAHRLGKTLLTAAGAVRTFRTATAAARAAIIEWGMGSNDKV